VLRVALLSGGGRRLLVEKAEEGDLQAIREVIDRLDGAKRHSPSSVAMSNCKT